MVKITYSPAFEEEQARIAEGLEYETYMALPGIPAWIHEDGPQRSKCHVLMRYRMAQHIPAVAGEAQAREARRKALSRSR